MASKKNLRKDSNIYLVGYQENKITGSKLPSKRQVLSVFFYYKDVKKLTIRESAKVVIEEVEKFWEKARIPVKQNYLVGIN